MHTHFFALYGVAVALSLYKMAIMTTMMMTMMMAHQKKKQDIVRCGALQKG